MRCLPFALLSLFGCGLTLDLTPPIDGAVPPGPDGGMTDAAMDAGPSCVSDDDCAEFSRGSCQSRCLSSGHCLLPDRDGDGLGPGCPEPDCDDNDPAIGSDGVLPCDPGLPGECAVGATQRCTDGELGSCEPARLPGDVPETCNGLDDDCDGVPDDLDAIVTDDICAPRYACTEGAWVAIPAPVFAEQCTPGSDPPADEDCDGRIDEGCTPEAGECIFVQPTAPAGPTLIQATSPAGGTPTVREALDLIERNPGTAPSRICLLAPTPAGTCIPRSFPVHRPIPGGVTIVGNLYSNGSTVERCTEDEKTILRPDDGRGIQITGGTGAPVTLRDLSVDFPDAKEGGNYRALDVQGGAGLVLSQVHVAPYNGDANTSRSEGIRLASGARLLAVASAIEGGPGEDEAYGIDATGAEVALTSSYDPTSTSPSDCSDGNLAVRGGSGSKGGAAIRTQGGTLTVTRYLICQDWGSAGIASDGTRVTLSDSIVSVRDDGGTNSDLVAVSLEGDPPLWLGRNTIEVWGNDQSPNGNGIYVGDGAAAVLFRNKITGGVAGEFDEAIGILCDGSCQLTDNLVTGLGEEAIANSAVAVRGTGSDTDALNLYGNILRGSDSSFVEVTAALVVDKGVGIFAGNDIAGGCADAGIATGLRNLDGSSLLENNVLRGFDCDSGMAAEAIGLEVAGGDLRANGNTISGGVALPSDHNCTSYGLLVTGGDAMAFRNNVFSGGLGCLLVAAVSADPLPEFFDHNGLTHGGFVDDAGALLTQPRQLLSLNRRYIGNVFTDTPEFVDYPEDLHIAASSPFARTGTRVGAPRSDIEGNLRPTPPSMGAYEP